VGDCDFLKDQIAVCSILGALHRNDVTARQPREFTMEDDVHLMAEFWARCAEGGDSDSNQPTYKEDPRAHRRRAYLGQGALPALSPITPGAPARSPIRPATRCLPPTAPPSPAVFNAASPGLGDRIFPAKLTPDERAVANVCVKLLLAGGKEQLDLLNGAPARDNLEVAVRGMDRRQAGFTAEEDQILIGLLRELEASGLSEGLLRNIIVRGQHLKATQARRVVLARHFPELAHFKNVEGFKKYQKQKALLYGAPARDDLEVAVRGMDRRQAGFTAEEDLIFICLLRELEASGLSKGLLDIKVPGQHLKATQARRVVLARHFPQLAHFESVNGFKKYQKQKDAAVAPSAASSPGKLFPWLHVACADHRANVPLSYDTVLALDASPPPIIPRSAYIYINYYKRTASIAAKWRLVIPAIVLNADAPAVPLPTFNIDDVARDTLSTILGVLSGWARGASVVAPPARDLVMAYVNYNEKSGGPHELVLLDSNTTAEDADLFNRAPDLVIVHAPHVDTFRARVAAGAAPACVDAGVAAGAAPARVAAGAAPTSDVFYSRRNAAQAARIAYRVLYYVLYYLYICMRMRNSCIQHTEH